MNRGLAAALLLCQNKGVAQSGNFGSVGTLAGNGWMGAYEYCMVFLGFRCYFSPQSQGFKQLPKPRASHCLSLLQGRRSAPLLCL